MNRQVKILLYSMLIFPLLGYIYLQIGLPKSITQLYVFIFFFYGLYFYATKKIILVPKFLYPLAVFMLYFPIRAHIAGAYADKNILTIIYYDILHLSTFLLVVIIYNTKFEDKFIRTSIKIIKVTIIIACLVSIIQVFDRTFLDLTYLQNSNDDILLNQYLFRRESIYSYTSNALGLSFIPLVAVFLGYSLFSKNKNYFVYIIGAGLVALLSNGRYIIIGFFIISLQIILNSKTKIAGIIKYATSAMIGILILYLMLIYLGYDLEQWFSDRLFREGNLEGTTRYKALITFGIFFPQAPFFGTGANLTDEIELVSGLFGSSQIHVGYLSNLVSYGVVGCSFLFGFWFLLARHLFQNAKKNKYWGSFFAFLTFIWAQATLVLPTIFFYGLIFALIFDKHYSDQYKIRIEMPFKTDQ